MKYEYTHKCTKYQRVYLESNPITYQRINNIAFKCPYRLEIFHWHNIVAIWHHILHAFLYFLYYINLFIHQLSSVDQHHAQKMHILLPHPFFTVLTRFEFTVLATLVCKLLPIQSIFLSDKSSNAKHASTEFLSRLSTPNSC